MPDPKRAIRRRRYKSGVRRVKDNRLHRVLVASKLAGERFVDCVVRPDHAVVGRGDDACGRTVEADLSVYV